MSEAELITLTQDARAQIATLYGQVISINFAMVVAIYYFLNRSRMNIKLLAFVLYLIGMFMFIRLMLEQSNVARIALNALREWPAGKASSLAASFVAVGDSWLFNATAVFLKGALWALTATIAYLLFVWRKPGDPK